jgi:putative transposase
MRAEGIRAKTVKQWHATTQSNHRMPVAANVRDRQLSVTRPNQVWAGDITYVWTTEGWLYLAVVLDLYSRAVIGWALEARLTGDLTQQALTMAIRHRTPKAGLLHHSDRGSQLCHHGLPATAHDTWDDPAACRDGGTVGTMPMSRVSLAH